MKRAILVGTLAAAAVAAMACGSDRVASPDKTVSNTGGTSGGSDSSHTSPGDSSTHGNPDGNHRYPWLTISPEAASLQLHNYLALHATEYDTNGTPVSAKISWRSSDEHLATVSDTGLVHGVGLGVVTIFASADGINDSAVVAVVDTAVVSTPPDSGTVPPDTTRRPPPDSSTVPDSTPPAPPPPGSVPPDTVPPGDTLTAR